MSRIPGARSSRTAETARVPRPRGFDSTYTRSIPDSRTVSRLMGSSMKLRSLVAALLLSVAGVIAGGTVSAATPGPAAASSEAGTDTGHAYPAAFPKGHYGALDRLPDWGGIWYLDFPPAPGAKRERPQLKGKYLEDYEQWQKQVKATN